MRKQNQDQLKTMDFPFSLNTADPLPHQRSRLFRKYGLFSQEFLLFQVTMSTERVRMAMLISERTDVYSLSFLPPSLLLRLLSKQPQYCSNNKCQQSSCANIVGQAYKSFMSWKIFKNKKVHFILHQKLQTECLFRLWLVTIPLNIWTVSSLLLVKSLITSNDPTINNHIC